MTYIKQFADNIIRIRKQKDISQIILAKKMNVSSAYISSLESGNTNPSLKSIIKISKALEVKMSELLNFQDNLNSGYSEKLGLLKENLKKNKKWYHQRFDGSPYMLGIIGEAETFTDREIKKDLAFSVHYCFFEKHTADWYILQDDIDRVTKNVLDSIKNDKDYSKNLIKSWESAEERLVKTFDEYKNINWYKLSDEKIIEKNTNLVNIATERFSSSSIIDGFALGSDTILEKRLKEIYNKSNKKEIDFAKFFSALTAPTENSFSNIAEIDLFKAALKIKKCPSCKQEVIENYRDKYFWIRNNYIDSYDLQFEYFELEIMRLVGGSEDLEKRIKLYEESPQKAKERKNKIIKDFELDEYTQRIIEITDKFTAWQDERKKSTMLYTHYFSKIIEEVSRRTGIDSELIKYLSPRKLNDVFEKSNLSEELKKIEKNSVFCWVNDGFDYVARKDEIKKIKEIIIGKDEKEKIEDFRGMIASTGKITGNVVVLKSARDIDLVSDGDVLVAVMTRTDYVPAMKRASAIITNEGGITCHAAIVSRELNKPCIIGTKIATQVLQTGDFVEVDANHGVVKILKKVEKR